MKLMLMAGSLRQDSVNKQLIRLTHELLAQQGVAVEVKEFNDYAMPIYDGDIEAKGLPDTTLRLIHDMNECDGLIFAIPEYNYSMPGSFKNLVDWVSRAKPMPWANKKILLLAASPALPGGVRGLWQMRVPFEGCGAFVYPEMFTVANAYNAFDPKGHLIDKALQERLSNLLLAFAAFVSRNP